MALLVAALVVVDGALAIGAARDHGGDVFGSEILSQMVGIVALVGQQMLGSREAGEKSGRGLDVGNVAGGQPKAEGSADEVGKQMNFRRFPAAREADRLRERPPFPPKADR